MHRTALEVSTREWLTAVPFREEKEPVDGRQRRVSLCIICLFLSFKCGLYSSINFLTGKKNSSMIIVSTPRNASTVLEVSLG